MTKPSSQPEPRLNEEVLAHHLEKFLTRDFAEVLHNTPRTLWGSFIRGVVFGFGTVVGATLLVTLAIFILQHLGALPGVGQFFQDLGQTIQNHPAR